MTTNQLMLTELSSYLDLQSLAHSCAPSRGGVGAVQRPPRRCLRVVMTGYGGSLVLQQLERRCVYVFGWDDRYVVVGLRAGANSGHRRWQQVTRTEAAITNCGV